MWFFFFFSRSLPSSHWSIIFVLVSLPCSLCSPLSVGAISLLSSSLFCMLSSFPLPLLVSSCLLLVVRTSAFLIMCVKTWSSRRSLPVASCPRTMDMRVHVRVLWICVCMSAYYGYACACPCTMDMRVHVRVLWICEYIPVWCSYVTPSSIKWSVKSRLSISPSDKLNVCMSHTHTGTCPWEWFPFKYVYFKYSLTRVKILKYSRNALGEDRGFAHRWAKTRLFGNERLEPAPDLAGEAKKSTEKKAIDPENRPVVIELLSPWSTRSLSLMLSSRWYSLGSLMLFREQKVVRKSLSRIKVSFFRSRGDGEWRH